MDQSLKEYLKEFEKAAQRLQGLVSYLEDSRHPSVLEAVRQCADGVRIRLEDLRQKVAREF